MKKLFKGYYEPSKEEFTELWNNCIFVLDANVLLNLYRYTDDTSERLIQILREFSKRLWIPYQAAFEFHENRIDVITKQENAYKDIEDSISKTLNKFRSDLGGYRKHPLIDTVKILKEVESFFNKYCDELRSQSEKHPNLLENDKLLIEITNLLEDKVGAPYSQEELAKLYREAETRYSKEIPPGYLDSKKDGDRKFGDYVLWQQMINKAKSDNKPMIFVTDDAKEDWWRSVKEKTLGPRPELIAEMLKEASVPFYMYRPDKFMEYASSFLQKHVDHKAIEEVKEISLRNKEFQEQSALEFKLESLIKTQESMTRELMILEQQQKVLQNSYQQILEEESRARVDFDSIDGDMNFFYDLSKSKALHDQKNRMAVTLSDMNNQIQEINYQIAAINSKRAYIDKRLAYEAIRSQYPSDRSGPTCVHCGSHGPWNGRICLSCGNLDDGDY